MKRREDNSSMTIEHQILEDCEKLRLLSKELEKTALNYAAEHRSEIETVQLRNIGEYVPPVFIQNFRGHMTSAMVLYIQGTLDFWLPRVIKFLGEKYDIKYSDRGKNGYLEWSKKVVSTEFCLSYDFGTKNYNRLTRLGKIRNDETHNGGFVSESNWHLPPEPGIESSMNLYYIRFEYCQDIINVSQQYLIDLINAPKI